VLDSTSSVRDLVLSYQELLGIEGGSAPPVQRDAQQQVRELTQDWLTGLLGMDLDLS
jgi:hypothetical protein